MEIEMQCLSTLGSFDMVMSIPSFNQDTFSEPGLQFVVVCQVPGQKGALQSSVSHLLVEIPLVRLREGTRRKHFEVTGFCHFLNSGLSLQNGIFFAPLHT